MSEKELSILIPVYNQDAVPMAHRLVDLCEAIDGLRYEIIVGDDCSTDTAMKTRNRELNAIPCCRYAEKSTNGGAGATRNFLARESRYRCLLFIDCEMDLPDGFIRRYLEYDDDVVNGGISIKGDEAERHNLRYLYEMKAIPMHTAEKRNQRPHKSFRSTNFMVSRQVMIDNPFHEPMRRYEDVFFGKTLNERGVKILHIDNPVVVASFDTNEEYIRKVEKDMATLAAFSKELSGYSPLLSLADTMQKWVAPMWMMKLFHRLSGRMIRRNLTGKRPWLKLLNVYKLGFFMTMRP